MTVAKIINIFIEIGLALIPLMAAAAFLAFILGVAKFIRASGNEKDIKDGKNFLIWGVIGMFVLITIWGIITFLSRELGLGDDIGVPIIPTNLKGVRN